MRNAIILAAGLGTRLRPLTNEKPKCLVEVGGKTLLGRWIEEMERCGVNNIIVNTHYMAEKVNSYIQEMYASRVSIVHEEVLLGTGCSVRQVINQGITDELIVVHADNFMKGNCDGLFEKYKTRPGCCEATLLLFRSDKPESCGIVEINEQGVITGYEEKPKYPMSNLANGAVCVLSERAQVRLREEKGIEDFARDFLPRMTGTMNGWLVDQYYDDIGTFPSLHKARSIIRKPN